MFQKLLSLLFLPPWTCTFVYCVTITDPGKWHHGKEEDGMTKEKSYAWKREQIGLHLSGLEGLLGRRRLDVRGGEACLLSQAFCAEVLEGRSVLDRSREAQGKGMFSPLLKWSSRSRPPHRSPSQQPGAAAGPSQECPWVSTPELMGVGKNPTWSLLHHKKARSVVQAAGLGISKKRSQTSGHARNLQDQGGANSPDTNGAMWSNRKFVSHRSQCQMPAGHPQRTWNTHFSGIRSTMTWACHLRNPLIPPPRGCVNPYLHTPTKLYWKGTGKTVENWEVCRYLNSLLKLLLGTEFHNLDVIRCFSTHSALAIQ